LPVLLALGGVGDSYRVGDLVTGDALDGAGQAQAVVSVEVGDADAGDVGGCLAGQVHLSLGAFSGVEQDAVGVPTQEVGVVVASAGGYGAGGSQDEEFTHRHVHDPGTYPLGWQECALWVVRVF